MVDVNFDVPEYYKPRFKGRKPKYCPECKSEMEYDGWGSDGYMIEEWWYCPKCKKFYRM